MNFSRWLGQRPIGWNQTWVRIASSVLARMVGDCEAKARSEPDAHYRNQLAIKCK
jgi:hypothetical protein